MLASYGAGLAFRPALSVFAIGLLMGFCLGMGFWARKLLGYSTEQPTRQYNLDVPNPGYTNYLETDYNPGGAEGHYYQLPVTVEQLRQVANLIVSGASFSHATLAGPGKPLTRSEYESLRTTLEHRGWITPRNPRSPNQGYVVVGRGIMNFERIVNNFSPTWGRGMSVVRDLSGDAHTHTQVHT